MGGGFFDEVHGKDGRLKYLVNGEWKESTSGRGQKVTNPTTQKACFEVQGEVCQGICTIPIRSAILCACLLKQLSCQKQLICQQPVQRKFHNRPAACTQDEVNGVFDAAKKAQKQWARTPLWKRAEYLHKVCSCTTGSGHAVQCMRWAAGGAAMFASRGACERHRAGQLRPIVQHPGDA